jgi:small-conductance mechanosensitive channel
MFHDLRDRVTRTRRALAWVLLLLLLALAAFFLPNRSVHPGVQMVGKALFWALGSILAVRVLAFLLLDPLLRQRKTATPGFARDLIVVALYTCAAALILAKVVHVDLKAILGTGAIAAAVVGLSLQETLGNLFAGISLHLDPAFRVGDWVEITGNLRGGPGRESLIAQVESMTWRTVQLRTENGDTDIIPNRLMAQAVVTNLYAPAGLHRRTARVIVEPHPDLHLAVAKLTRALAGIPHQPDHRPEVVVHSFDMGGAVFELRWWALGYRHGRAGNFLALRLACTVLPREGFPLLGPHGATTLHPRHREMSEAFLKLLLEQLHLPAIWASELKGKIVLRQVAPDEGIIREGDPGNSLFAVLEGSVKVVRVVEQNEPFTGLAWETIATLGPGQWFGEASLLTGSPRMATVVAETATELVEIPKAAFEQSIKREPQVLERLVDLMEARVRTAETQVPEQRAARREQWLAQIRHWFDV